MTAGERPAVSDLSHDLTRQGWDKEYTGLQKLKKKKIKLKDSGKDYTNVYLFTKASPLLSVEGSRDREHLPVTVTPPCESAQELPVSLDKVEGATLPALLLIREAIWGNLLNFLVCGTNPMGCWENSVS